MTHIKDKEYLGQLDLSDDPYAWSVIGLWRDEEGFYLGTDSGCSCNGPWESHSNDSLTGPLTLDAVIEESHSLWSTGGRLVPESRVKDFHLIALNSFLTTLDTRWLVEGAWDVPNEYGIEMVTLKDSKGVQWFHDDDLHKYNLYHRADFGATKDVYELDYPVEILEVRKN